MQMLMRIEMSDLHTQIEGFFHLGAELGHDFPARNFPGEKSLDKLPGPFRHYVSTSGQTRQSVWRQHRLHLGQREVNAYTQAGASHSNSDRFFGEIAAVQQLSGTKHAAIEGFRHSLIYALGETEIIGVDDQ